MNDWVSYKGDKLTASSEVKGYEDLDDLYKQRFEQFLKNFYKSWEFPEQHIPVKVAFKKDKSNGSYLRVDFKDGTWLHVTGSRQWY